MHSSWDFWRAAALRGCACPCSLRRRTTQGIVSSFALLSLLLIAAGCSTSKADNKPKEKPLPEVFAAHPRKEKVGEFEEFTGYLAAVEAVEVRARVSGYLDDFLFVEGSEVKKDDLLFKIDDRIYKAQADNAAAMLKQAIAKRDGLQAQFNRADELRKRKAISEQEAEVLQYQLEEAIAAVAAAEAMVESANLDLSYTRVTAPITGVIGNRRIDRGNLVKADDTLLATIVAQDPIYAYFDVNERTVLRLRRIFKGGQISASEGGKLKVFAALADEEEFTHEGEIDFVDNQLDPATGTLRVRATLRNPDRLLSPGLFVRLQFPIGEPQDSLLVPEEALGADQGERYLLVIDEKDAVQYRRVKVGPLRDGYRVIREGLEESERVIVKGLQRVRPGDQVRVTLEGESASPPPPPTEEASAEESENATEEKSGDATPPEGEQETPQEGRSEEKKAEEAAESAPPAEQERP